MSFNNRWFENNEFILHNIYSFNHLPFSNSQNDNEFSNYLKLFQQFSTTNFLSELSNVLEDISNNTIRYLIFGEFGCALIGVWNERRDVLSLYLCFPDSWSFGIHSSNTNNSRKFNAKPNDNQSFCIGDIPTKDFDSFIGKFYSLLADAKTRKNENRSAGHNDQGLQKTPSFVEALLTQAMDTYKTSQKVPLCASRGGTSDVGMHTGSDTRHTIWPIFEAVIQQLLFLKPTTSMLSTYDYTKIAVKFHLWILDCQLIFLEESKSITPIISAEMIDAVHKILTTACHMVVSITDDSFHSKFIKISIEKLKSRIVKLSSDSAVHYASQYKILHTIPTDFRPIVNPEPIISEPVIASNSSSNIQELRNLAKSNLEVFPIYGLINPSTIPSLDYKRLHNYLHRINDYFINEATNQLKNDSSDTIYTELYLSNIEILVNAHTLAINRYYSLPHYPGMREELRSQNLLVKWTAYCLAHKYVIKKFSYLAEYGVSLRSKHFQHLVLSDKRFIETMVIVASYLDRHRKDGRELFSLLPNDKTFVMAIKYGDSITDNLLTTKWNREFIDANKRIKDHWQIISDKKLLCRNLRNQISSSEITLARLEASLPSWYHTDYDSISGKISKINEEIANYEKELKIANTPPPAVYQPLPENKDLAMKLLFFHYIPNNIRILSILSFTAQEMLVPTSFEYEKLYEETPNSSFERVKNITAVPDYKTNLDEYYKSKTKQIGTRSLQISQIFLKSVLPTTEEKHVKKETVDLYNNMKDGIFYPDNLSPSLVWGSGKNHFSIGEFPKLVAGEFCPVVYKNSSTEKQQSDNKLLSQFLFLFPDSTPACRGNEAIASQDRKPDWMSKPNYLSFGIIRAFPTTSYDQLCLCLQKNDMLLDRDEFHILIRLVFYHVGPITNGATLGWRLRWQTSDVFTSCSFIKIEGIISKLVDTIKEKPSLRQSLYILGEISDYLSQWSSASRAISRQISKIFFDWANDIEKSLSEQPSEDTSVSRKQQCIFYMLSILSHQYGEMSKDDYVFVCKANALANRVRFVDDISDLANTIRRLTILTHSLMSRRFDEMKQFLHSDVLSSICKCIIFSTPLNLIWEMIVPTKEESGCYDAMSNGGNLFSINIITGVVLYDGKALGKLGNNIITHPLYVKTFGDRNFEVTMSSTGIAETLRPLGSHFYSFHLNNQNSYLTIVEKHSNGDELELLVTVENARLPKWLLETCSQWLCRKKTTILFRGIKLENREVRYLMLLRSVWECVEVPIHLQKKTMDELLIMSYSNTLDKVIMNKSKIVINILNKFDEKEYIITLWNETTGNVIFSFPRYKLRFELRDCGRIYSLDFSEFTLDVNQQFDDMLHLFDNYLVISRGKLETKMIVCYYSDFTKSSTGILENMKPTFKYHIYDLDMRQNLFKANCISSRLYLAALSAATSRELPDTRYSTTGATFAQSLVRGCWCNSPLATSEADNLLLVTKFTGPCPELLLICDDLFKISSKLSLTTGSTIKISAVTPNITKDSKTQYVIQKHNEVYRRSLDKYESLQIFGSETTKSFSSPTSLTKSASIQKRGVVLFAFKHFDFDIVERTEKRLTEFVLSKVREKGELFPITDYDQTNIAEQMIITPLLESWNEYHNLPEYYLSLSIKDFKDLLNEEIFGKIKFNREHYQKILLDYLNNISTDLSTPSCFKFEVLQLIDFEPTAGVRDLLDCAMDCNKISIFNPFLSSAGIRSLHRGIILWMKLCVLEDKLNRILNSDSEDIIVQEIQSYRIWDASEYVPFLIFEVENKLQIRPVQFKVFSQIINNECTLFQLNMGEGKTRVILPMLIMYYTIMKKREDCIMRIVFLTQLINEAYDYLHKVLTTSVLRIKLLKLPFNRDIKLTKELFKVIRIQYNICLECNGVFVLAPEHILSLFLKKIELQLSIDSNDKELSKTIVDQDKAFKSIDILDESDELLRQSYQLVYAVGIHACLDGVDSRINIAATILDVLSTDPKVLEILSRPDVAVFEDEEHHTSEQFRKIRFLPTEAFQNNKSELMFSIASKIINDPPYEVFWLKNEKYIEHRDNLIRFVTDDKVIGESLFGEDWLGMEQKEKNDLFAMRGFLAYDILTNCLLKRHRIDYGINRLVPARKRTAVPFRANDIPSLRSEYSHPDSAICLTLLSYFRDGLSEKEMKELFKALSKLSDSAQNDIYNLWMKIIPTNKPNIDHISKIDVTNTSQFQELYQTHRFNRLVISFWLNSYVLYPETMQYPSKLIATPWNLANSDRVNGFSGTDDNRLLLPLQVKQQIADSPVIKSTNGKMVHLFMVKNEKYVPLNSSCIVDQLLSIIVSEQCHALIDCGGLVVGTTNIYFAVKFLEVSDNFDAVTFFNTDTNHWQILSRLGEMWDVESAPIQVRDTFVYFDEYRCRGADLKLVFNAYALVTLGPKINKDKLFQAIFRLRGIDKSQCFLTCGTVEVSKSIDQLVSGNNYTGGNINSVHILDWVTDNTIQSIKLGMTQWIAQGLHFNSTNNLPASYSVQPEVSELKKFYSHRLDHKTVQSIFEDMKTQNLSRVSNGEYVDTINNGMIEEMSRIANEFGSDYKLITSNLDEECERELEREVEKEEEKEIEVDRKVPCNETEMDHNEVLGNSEIFNNTSRYIEISKFIESRMNSELHLRIPWKCITNKIYLTVNFAISINCHKNELLDEFLCPVHFFLYLKKNKSFLLISEREADYLITNQYLDRYDEVVLVELEFWEDSLKSYLTTIINHHQRELLVRRIVTLNLFNGCTMFPDENEKQVVRSLLKKKHARNAVLLLPSSRGYRVKINRSDLDYICQQFCE